MKDEVYDLAYPKAAARPQAGRLPGALRRWLKRHIHLLLFTATLVSTLFVGAYSVVDFYLFQHGGFPVHLRNPVNAILFPAFLFPTLAYTAAMLGFLTAHEMGHYFLCRRNGLDASLPYYLPNPLIFGTFGAVIRIRSQIRNKRALFDVGAAGPLTGIAVALPVLVIGTAMSATVPPESVAGSDAFWTLGQPLFQQGVNAVFFNSESDISVIMSPLAMVGWFGLLVTALNLLPVSQLDGGHILYAVFGKRHHIISMLVVVIMIATGLITRYFGWLFWALLVALLGLRHPPLAEEDVKLDKPRLVLAVVTLLVFIGSFNPVPIEVPELFEEDWSLHQQAVDPPAVAKDLDPLLLKCRPGFVPTA